MPKTKAVSTAAPRRTRDNRTHAEIVDRVQLSSIDSGKLYHYSEIAKILDVKESRIYDWLYRDMRLGYLQMPRGRLVPGAELIRFLSERFVAAGVWVMASAKQAQYRRGGVANDRPQKPDSLIGSFFHSFTGRGVDRCLQYTGQVVAEPHPGIYLVELYSSMDGTPCNQSVFSIEEMLSTDGATDWHFYDTSVWMSESYDRNGGWHRQRGR